MLARCCVVLALYQLLACASNIHIRAHDASLSNETISNTPSLAASAAAPPPTPVDLLANHSISRPHSTHRPPSNGTHHPTTHSHTLTPAGAPSPKQTFHPGDVSPPRGSGPSVTHAKSNGKGRSVAQIFFEALGGVVGALVLLAILRCIYVYKKTPHGRRSPSPEVGEVDRTMALLRNPWRPRDPLPPPPPPYQPAPDYDTALHSNIDISHPPRPPDPPEA